MLPGLGHEAQGGPHQEAVDALAAHQQLRQVGTGIGLHPVHAKAVDAAVVHEGVHSQHPVAGHAVLAGVGPARIGGQGAAQGAALPGVGVRWIEQADGLGSGLHLPQRRTGRGAEAEVPRGDGDGAGPLREVHHHGAVGGHTAPSLAGTGAPGDQAEALALGPLYQLPQGRRAVGLDHRQRGHAAHMGLIPEPGLQRGRVPNDGGLGEALEGVHGSSVTEGGPGRNAGSA